MLSDRLHAYQSKETERSAYKGQSGDCRVAAFPISFSFVLYRLFGGMDDGVGPLHFFSDVFPASWYSVDTHRFRVVRIFQESFIMDTAPWFHDALHLLLKQRDCYLPQIAGRKQTADQGRRQVLFKFRKNQILLSFQPSALIFFQGG